MTPTAGRIVLYKISDHDAQAINRRRDDYENYTRPTPAEEAARTMGVDVAVFDPGRWNATGHQAHVGNTVTPGLVFPAIIVRTFGGDAVNLHVFLDGNDTYWATSRGPGDGEGQWAWPARFTGGMFTVGTTAAATAMFEPILPQPPDGPDEPAPRSYEYPVGG